MKKISSFIKSVAFIVGATAAVFGIGYFAFGAWQEPTQAPPQGNPALNSQWVKTGNDIYYNAGNVGIGTTSIDPDYKLNVLGPIRLNNNVNDFRMQNIAFQKGRAGAIVQNGDELGYIDFYGYDGANYKRSAYVISYVDGAPAIGSVPGRLSFFTTPAGAGESVERMRITSTGNVGIGTPSPSMPLDVAGTIKSKNYSVNIAEFIATSYGADFESGPNKHLVKIKTNFPYTDGSQMPALFIEGYDYGGANTLGIVLAWYIYGGNFVNARASSYGSIAPQITLANEGGKVVILLAKPSGARWYYSRFTIRALLSFGNTEYLKGWQFGAESITGINTLVVPFDNAFNNGYFSGKVGIGTTNPQRKLVVQTDTRVDPSTGIAFYNIDPTNPSDTVLSFRADTTGSGATVFKELSAIRSRISVHDNATAASDLEFFVTNSGAISSAIKILPTGNVGIGTTNPGAKLEVNGGVRLNTTDAKPNCDANTRGILWFTQGATNDAVEVCILKNSSYIWKNLVN